MRMIAALCIVLLGLVAACDADEQARDDPTTISSTTTMAPSGSTVTLAADLSTTTTRATTEPAPMTTEESEDGPVPITPTGEATPDPGVTISETTIDVAAARAASDTGLGRDDLVVKTAAQVVWPDTSLGCPSQGEAYLQVLTDGYWVVFETPHGTLDYRSELEVDFRRCHDGFPPHSILVDR